MSLCNFGSLQGIRLFFIFVHHEQTGVTLDAYIDHQSLSAATVDNRVTIPSSTSFGGGLRYNFEIEDKSFTLRVSVYNLGNTYRLIPIGSGVYTYNNPMNATIYLAADF